MCVFMNANCPAKRELANQDPGHTRAPGPVMSRYLDRLQVRTWRRVRQPAQASHGAPVRAAVPLLPWPPAGKGGPPSAHPHPLLPLPLIALNSHSLDRDQRGRGTQVVQLGQLCSFIRLFKSTSASAPAQTTVLPEKPSSVLYPIPALPF